MRNLFKDRSVTVKSPEKAIEQYKADGKPKSRLRSYPMKVKEIIIDDIELVYYFDAGSVRQDEIRPNYLISGRFIGVDGSGGIVNSTFEWLEDAVGE